MNNLFTITFDSDSDTSTRDAPVKDRPMPPAPNRSVFPPGRRIRPVPKPVTTKVKKCIVNLENLSDSEYFGNDGEVEVSKIKASNPTFNQNSVQLDTENQNNTNQVEFHLEEDSENNEKLAEEEEEANENKIEDKNKNENEVKEIPENVSIESQNQVNNIQKQNNHEAAQHYELVDPLNYVIKRNASKFGNKTQFFFIDNSNNVIYTAKLGKKKMFSVFQGESNNEIAAILCSPQYDSFSLRKTNQYGDELMAFRISHSDNGRRFKVYFFVNEKNEYPSKLQDSVTIGKSLDFGGREFIESTKNFILFSDDIKEFIAVRKIEKNKLAVDFQPVIPVLYVFSVAIVAYFCKK